MAKERILTIARSENFERDLIPSLNIPGYDMKVISDADRNKPIREIEFNQPFCMFIDSEIDTEDILSIVNHDNIRDSIPVVLLLHPGQFDDDLIDEVNPVTCLGVPYNEQQIRITVKNVKRNLQYCEKKAKVNVEGYAAIFDTSAAGIWCFEVHVPVSVNADDETFLEQIFKNSTLVECNDGLAQMYGYTEGSDFVGAPLNALLNPEDAGNIEYLLNFKHNNYRLFNAETRELDRYGKVKVFLNNLVGIVEDGYILRAWGSQIDITERKQNEELQKALYEISEASHSAETLDALYVNIHEILQTLMPAKNMYIAKYNAAEDEVEFPYYQDTQVNKPAPRKGGKGLTEYVIKNARPFLASEEDIERLTTLNEIKTTGYPAYDWLGVPLKTQNEVIGALVVQNYDEGLSYTQREKNILTFVSHQIATAITRKQTEKALQLLSHAMEYTTDDLLITDCDGWIEYVNSAFEKLSGVSREKLVGEHISRLNGEKLENQFYQQLMFAIENNKAFHGETCRSVADKNTIYHEQVFTPVKNREGQVTNFISIGRDITERKKIEEQLRRSQDRLQIILSQLPAMFWTTDTDLNFTYSTGAAINMMDEDAQNSKNTDLYKYFKTADENFLPIAQHRKALKGKSGKYEMQWGGRVFESLVEPLRNENNQIVGCIGIALDITERKEAENKLTHERNLLELLLENVPDTIYFKDRESRFIKVNEAQAAVLGAESPEATTGKTDYDFFAEVFANEALRDEKEIFRTKKPLIGKPEKVVDKDGNYTWFSVTKIPIIESSGEVNGLVGISRDITKLKESEDLQSALYEISEATHSFSSLERIFSAIHQIINNLMPATNFYICLYDKEKDLLTYPYFVDEYDTAPEPYAPKNGLTEYVLRENLPLLLSEQSLKDLIEKEGLNLKGTLPVDWLGVPLRADNGIIGVLVVQSYAEGVRYSLRDKDILSFVSDQVALTIARKQTEAALSNEKERLAVTLRSIGDGVITTDVNGMITMMNRMAEELTEYKSHQAIGLHIDDVYKTLDEKTREYSKNPLEQLIELNFSGSIPREVVLISKRDREYIIADSIAPLRDDRNTTIGTVIVFRDLSEQREMEKEVLKSRKLESVGVLAGGIAHDFNNILSSILGNISLAKLANHSPEKIQELLNNAEEGTTRAAKLTKQLLTFSKGGAPVKEEAAIGELVRNSVQFALRGSNVRPKIVLADDLWPANIDTGQIDQVIQNLIINADQAMPEGGTVLVQVENREILTKSEVTGLRPGKYIVIEVNDQGVGISEDNLPRIFDPYFTTKSTGSGLGLATSYAIVQKHGGQLIAHSKMKFGTTITVFLPVADSPIHPRSVLTEESQKLSLPKGDGKILLLDDDPNVHKTAAAMLRELGFSVGHANDGKEAIDRYRDSIRDGVPYDAVILDLTIPGGMSGKDAAEALTKEYPDIKAIVSSGYSTDPIMAEYEKYGFSGKVEKPYNMQRLAETIHCVLQNSA